MTAYIAQRIIDGVYSYDYVIDKRPDLKTEIDEYLSKQNSDNLTTQNDVSVPSNNEERQEKTKSTSKLKMLYASIFSK